MTKAVTTGEPLSDDERGLLTMREYAERYMTPMLLRQAGLPDTEAGRAALDEMVRLAYEHDA